MISKRLEVLKMRLYTETRPDLLNPRLRWLYCCRYWNLCIFLNTFRTLSSFKMTLACDFVIARGGTAGLIATRLSENPDKSVLALVAGADLQ